MSKRVFNFNPGPATLPLSALEKAQSELVDFAGSGMSILEHSHRGKDYEAVHNQTIALFKELLSIPDNYYVLFMQGGASAQFAMVPMNLIPKGGSADYILTGSWSKKALSEAKTIGTVRIAADASVNGAFVHIPKQSELNLDPKAAYCHITSNNTIAGTQWSTFPDTGSVPLIADMSSDMMWRPFDVSKFGLIYAGAQKNLGPAGVTVVIVRKDLVENGRTDIPKIFTYQTHAKENSLYNTPPCFSIYIVGEVLKAVKAHGGLSAVEKDNRAKGNLLYGFIDANLDYYRCPVEKEARSYMNVVFRLPSEDLEAKFVSESKSAGLIGLKGHRSVGGCRASIYNAMPLAGVQKLVDFMANFKKSNPA
jgi:phosphoserine aminotransferase